MNQETNYENVVRCGTICEIWELREMWDVYEPWRHANLAQKMPQMDVKFSKFSGVEPPDSLSIPGRFLNVGNPGLGFPDGNPNLGFPLFNLGSREHDFWHLGGSYHWKSMVWSGGGLSRKG